MMRYTKEARQKIVQEFAEAHGGVFDPAEFLGVVSQVGSSHPAYDWFQWDNERAAREHRLDQARDFARGLVVSFKVQTLSRGKVKIVAASAPMVISPMEHRDKGGGYVITNDNDPSHILELCRQGAQAMRWFISRFEAAVAYSGGEIAALQQLQAAMDAASSERLPEAAE